MARDTSKLKALIFSTLNDDTDLRDLLGGTGRVRHGNPNHKAEYPLVTYYIVNDVDNPYDCDRDAEMVDSRVVVQCYTTSVDTTLVDQLNDRVFNVLDGKRLSTADVQVYNVRRLNSSLVPDTTPDIWRRVSNYTFVNVTR